MNYSYPPSGQLPTDGQFLSGLRSNRMFGTNGKFNNLLANELSINNVIIVNDLTVAKDASVGNDLTVARDASVGNDLTVTSDASVGNNLTVAKDASVGNDLTVTRDGSVGNDLTVTETLTTKQFINGATNVKYYGAIGDGVTDDYAVIQAVFDDPGVAAVYFPAGAYRISQTLILSSAKIVYGDGSAFSSILSDASVLITISLAANNCTLRDMTIGNLSAGAPGSVSVNVPNVQVTLELLSFFSNVERGIQVTSTNCIVVNCEIKGLTGIYADGTFFLQIFGGRDLSTNGITLNNTRDSFIAAPAFAPVTVQNNSGVTIVGTRPVIADGSSTYNVVGDTFYDASNEYRVKDTKVVGEQVIDGNVAGAINTGDATTDAIIEAMRTALDSHGLLKAA